MDEDPRKVVNSQLIKELVNDHKFLIKIYEIGKNENFLCVNFSDFTYLTILKPSIESEFYACQKLKNFSFVPSLKSGLSIKTNEKGEILYGFSTENLFMNLEKEYRLRTEFKFPYSLDEIKTIFFKLTSYLAYAEKFGLAHGPLSLHTIVRSLDMNLKIVGWGQEFFFGDFLLRYIPTNDNRPSYWNFVDPMDSLDENYYDHNVYKRDVFSLGKVIVRLLSGQYNLHEKIFQKLGLKDDILFEILKKVLNPKVNERPNFTSLLEMLISNNYDKIEQSKEKDQLLFDFLKEKCWGKFGLIIE